MSDGMCRYCGKTYKKGGIARHIAACSERQESHAGKGETVACHRLVVTDPAIPEYWLHLLAAPEATLGDLDRLLRTVWLECCDHGSVFTTGGAFWSSSGPGNYDTRLDQIPQGREIRYLYDYVFSTELLIRRLDPLQHRLPAAPVEIAARNDPPRIECGCEGSAATLFSRSLLYQSFDEAFFCPRCLTGFVGDPAMLAPLTNSPRMGVCRYYRSSADRAGDYTGFETTEELIRTFTQESPVTRLRTGTAEERDAIIQRHIETLQHAPPLREEHFQTARFIDVTIEYFASDLRSRLLEVVRGWEQTGHQPKTRFHVFALFLLSRIPDGELFVELAPSFTRYARMRSLWGDVLQEPRVREPLWASLCRDAPDLLQEFALQRSTDAFLRFSAVNALVTLYLKRNLTREALVAFLEELAAEAIETSGYELAEMVASACCTVYPEDLIRPVQRLHRAGLLSASRVDYLGNVQELLTHRTLEDHLDEVRSIGFFSLLDNPPAALEELTQDLVEWPPAEQPTPLRAPRNQVLPTESSTPVVRSSPKVGRNAPCPCGSGKKFKHCCGRA